jgi:type IV secretory pathway VirB10-like protein
LKLIRLVAIPTICLVLAGCLTTNEPAPAANPSAAPTASAAPAANQPAASPATRAPHAAARASNAPPPAPPEPAEPVDPILQIRQTCWSLGNANKSFKNIEARADWVNACIADKMKTLR